MSTRQNRDINVNGTAYTALPLGDIPISSRSTLWSGQRTTFQMSACRHLTSVVDSVRALGRENESHTQLTLGANLTYDDIRVPMDIRPYNVRTARWLT